MHGTIHYCLEKSIIDRFGKEKWEACLEENGLKKSHTFGMEILKDLNEDKSLNFFMGCTRQLHISLKELFDVFGEYWCCTYAPEMYPQFYEENKSTKEFILNLNMLHQKVTSKKPGSNPPSFHQDWEGDKLVVTYQSQRNLFELFESLLKGLDKYFGSETLVERSSENQLTLTFLPFSNTGRANVSA